MDLGQFFHMQQPHLQKDICTLDKKIIKYRRHKFFLGFNNTYKSVVGLVLLFYYMVESVYSSQVFIFFFMETKGNKISILEWGRGGQIWSNFLISFKNCEIV